MPHVPTAVTVNDVPWKQRFRAERVLWTALAEERPARGLAVSNRSGRFQLCAWEVPTGELRHLTDRPEGVVFGFIDSLGRHVYYLDDTGGNEIGHLVRVPFAGGEPEDNDSGFASLLHLRWCSPVRAEICSPSRGPTQRGSP